MYVTCPYVYVCVLYVPPACFASVHGPVDPCLIHTHACSPQTRIVTQSLKALKPKPGIETTFKKVVAQASKR